MSPYISLRINVLEFQRLMYHKKYFKCHTEIGPKLIVPMGPLPDVEEGFEPDFSKIKPGYVPLPEPRMQGAEKDVVHSKDGNFSIAKY